MEKVDILGTKINAINMNEAINSIEGLINSKSSHYICISNVHTLVTGVKDKKFRNVTNNASLALPDGMPLSIIGKIKGHKQMQRCTGPDLMTHLFEISEMKDYSHYFYGGTPKTLELLKINLNKNYPNLNIIGMHSPPFRKLTDIERTDILNEFNILKPDIIWIGLGAPKQELWMEGNFKEISSSILVGVGAAFNFHAGVLQRAPQWMQKFSLEWLYRLFQEPRRLWKRYLVTNSLFLYYLILENLTTIVKKIGK